MEADVRSSREVALLYWFQFKARKVVSGLPNFVSGLREGGHR